MRRRQRPGISAKDESDARCLTRIQKPSCALHGLRLRQAHRQTRRLLNDDASGRSASDERFYAKMDSTPALAITGSTFHDLKKTGPCQRLLLISERQGPR
jgi:hypothetical protein